MPSLPMACLSSPNASPNENPLLAAAGWAGGTAAAGVSRGSGGTSSRPRPTPPPAPPLALAPRPRRAGGNRTERWRRRCAFDLRAEGYFVLTVVEAGQRDEPAVGRFDHELAEAREASVLLVEVRVDLLHHLLQAVGAHDVVVRGHLLHCLDDQLPWVAAHVLDVARLGEAGELIVGVVLVAVLA